MENTSCQQVFSVNFDWGCDVILWLQNNIDHAVSQNKYFVMYWTTVAKRYVLCRNISQVVRLKIDVLQRLNV